MLRDSDIRQALIKKLAVINDKHISETYKIIEELAICDGEARADLVVANGRLCGYEIKSDRDTLERLPNQIRCYNATFDKVTIVVGEKFNDIILESVPEWWGIIVAYKNTRGNVSFKTLRKNKINPNVDAHALTELLWKEELISILKNYGIKGLSGKSRLKLRDIAVESIPLKEISKYTRISLKTRQDWRVN